MKISLKEVSFFFFVYKGGISLLSSFVNNNFVYKNHIVFTSGMVKNQYGFNQSISITKFRKLKDRGIDTIVFGIHTNDKLTNLIIYLSIQNAQQIGLNVELCIVSPSDKKFLKSLNKLIKMKNINHVIVLELDHINSISDNDFYNIIIPEVKFEFIRLETLYKDLVYFEKF